MKKPVKKQTAKKTRHSRKASANWPAITRFRYVRYLPAVIIALAATVLSIQPASLHQQNPNVLAYATNTSSAGLLSSTNQQRTSNGVSALSLNSKLSSAAQAKANDMVARNYWSHVTPDGKQPWVFITNAGYQYSSAGENLAYGFMTSADTVIGWMNSAPHRKNLLSSNYTEVGFGIANSANYISDGAQTVVVAMYGKPMAKSTPIAAPVQKSTPKQETKPAATQRAAEEPAESKPSENSKEVAIAQSETKEAQPIAVAETEQPVATASTTEVRRVQLLFNGPALWTVSAMTTAIVGLGVLWIIHKGFHFKRYLLAGEHFVARHTHLDLTVLAVLYLGFVLLSTGGTIR